MSTNNFKAVLSAVLFAGTVGGAGFLANDVFGHPPSARSSKNTPPVTGDIEELHDCLPTVDQPTRADDPKGWEFTGQTQAAAEDVRARVTGHLTRIAVREGDVVKKGDLLAEINSQAYRLDLETAQARRKAAEAKFQVAKIEAANTKKLFQQKVIGTDELALSEAKEGEAEAGLLGAKVEVRRAELTLSWAQIQAPFDGRVSRIQSTEGALVTADRTPVLRVVATDPLRVTFKVPEAVVLKLRREGLAEPSRLSVAVGFAGDQGHPQAAKLDSIEPEVDPKTGTVRFRATVSNAKGLLSPGLSARVRLTPLHK